MDSKTPGPDKITIVAQKEFTPAQIKRQTAKSRDKTLTEAERKKARLAVLEMGIYNARSLRGDFDTY